MYVVTGSGRSGTSAVARMVHESGLSVGRDLIEPDESNADGYFEERAVVALNARILTAAGLDAWFSTATREGVLAAARPFEVEMRELAAAATPAWKDPRFCWTLEAWLRILPEPPRIIVCLRSPAEVAASTMRYFGLEGEEPRHAVEHTWRAQYERLLDVIESYRLAAVCVDFSALHADPEGEAGVLERFLDRAVPTAGVRRDLRHHSIDMPLAQRPLYERVRALGADWRLRPAREAGA